MLKGDFEDGITQTREGIFDFHIMVESTIPRLFTQKANQ
jgi:hypothetical protein